MKTNLLAKKPDVFTHEGAKASHIDLYERIRRSVMANMLFEGTFYESGENNANRILADVMQAIDDKEGGAVRVADMAYEARTNMKLRHVPLYLLACMMHKYTSEVRTIISDVIYHVIQRPDEMGELIALWWKLEGKRKMLPAQVKNGLARALGKFNEYTLAKNDHQSAAIKLRDVLFLIHAKPVDEAQAELFKRITERKLVVPDTWEVELSAGKDKKATFERLLGEGKLGPMALLRNLRNMQGAGVSENLIKQALESMNTERVLPFRFITAARYAPKLEPQLERAMMSSLKSEESLKGKTILIVDNSRSMESPISGKSELLRSEAAAALGILLREICPDMELIVFGSTAGHEPARRGFAMRDVIHKSKHGGATNTDRAVKLANQSGYDRLIIITDEQSHTKLPPPLMGSRAYVINVAAYKNGIGYGVYTHISGWSESIVSYIRNFEE